jgi:hypothetical protein
MRRTGAVSDPRRYASSMPVICRERPQQGHVHGAWILLNQISAMNRPGGDKIENGIVLIGLGGLADPRSWVLFDSCEIASMQPAQRQSGSSTIRDMAPPRAIQVSIT